MEAERLDDERAGALEPDAMKKTDSGIRRAESREGMKIVMLALDPAVHRQLRFMSVDTGVAMAQLIRDAIDQWLQREKRSAREKRRR